MSNKPRFPLIIHSKEVITIRNFASEPCTEQPNTQSFQMKKKKRKKKRENTTRKYCSNKLRIKSKLTSPIYNSDYLLLLLVGHDNSVVTDFKKRERRKKFHPRDESNNRRVSTAWPQQLRLHRRFVAGEEDEWKGGGRLIAGPGHSYMSHWRWAFDY